PGTGSIIINKPQPSDEGIYQCFATNTFGTALSTKTLLKMAVLNPFKVKDASIHRPQVGKALQLRCTPPYSYPAGSVYWGTNRPGSRLTPIATNDRIGLDYDGNFYLANVRMEDFAAAATYSCLVKNSVLRSFVIGDDNKIIPQDGTPSYEAPKVEWTSDIGPVVIRGGMLRMKCIFSGYPTPRVTWRRLPQGTEMPRSHFFPEESANKELVINNVQFEDQGTYECSASNMDGGSTVSRKFSVRVQSMPFFIEKPMNVHSSEEENAEFLCKAGGSPQPEILWSINGIAVENLPRDSRRIVTQNSITYRNLTSSDAQVIQCNATNKHGYIFANAYLNVLAEAPSFIRAPDAVTKAAVSQDITLICEAFGAPDPEITWKRWREDDSGQKYLELVPGPPKFRKNQKNHLTIIGVSSDDQGTYECYASNKFGDVDASGDLIVRERTTIHERPHDATVNASTDVIFKCNATTDELEDHNLKYEWRKNGRLIDFQREGRLSMNMNDHSLIITGAQVEDSAEYTCVAGNGLDNDSISATLKVKDVPDPPTDVNMRSCGSNTAEITWTPGSDNNVPISEYIVFYNTSFDAAGEYTEGARVDASTQLSAKVKLSPWAEYTFHVQAVSAMGKSPRSAFTSSTCITPQKIPYTNPTGVCTESRAPDQLVIVWEPMPQMEHNGEGFAYFVSYRRKNYPGAQEISTEVTDWRQTELVVGNQEIFSEYEISVRAKNSKGFSPPGTVEYKTGYSGEDVPLVSAQNFAVDESSINSTSARFVWDPVTEDPAMIRGFFKGYESVIINEWNPCPALVGSMRRRRRASQVSAHTNELWPYSRITAGVLVANGGKTGPLSDTITFDTPEGLPSIVRNFRVTETGSHHLKMEWDPPLFANGVLLGYVVGFRTGEGDEPLGDMNELDVSNPLQLYKKALNLEPETRYLVYIWAFTGKGRGPRESDEAQTGPEKAPDAPGFGPFDVGDDFVNVSFVPTADGEDVDNPGSEFYIEYRPSGEDEWQSTDPEKEHNWVNVTGLEPGQQYEFRIVARNGAKQETRSKSKTILVGPDTKEVREASVATAGWFIALMIIIIFLLLILFIVCLIKRNRGGKYPVHEKEKLRGRDPDDEEAPFGEYTRTEPDYKKSQGSIDSEQKPLESDTDSMAEYDDPDAGKFNEDGSFIGQYGGKKRGSQKENDVKNQSALSTFV
ncbi:hypothetical protein CAPTEDRAFT_120325, partial [Capitella teleta]